MKNLPLLEKILHALLHRYIDVEFQAITYKFANGNKSLFIIK